MLVAKIPICATYVYVAQFFPLTSVKRNLTERIESARPNVARRSEIVKGICEARESRRYPEIGTEVIQCVARLATPQRCRNNVR